MVTVRKVAAVLLGIFFIAAGINHYVHSGFYVRAVPPWLPLHLFLVQISGACEIFGGIGVLVPLTRRISGIGLIALLVAVFPANIQMAQHPQLYHDVGSAWIFYVRLPLQFLMIVWVWWTCLRSHLP